MDSVHRVAASCVEPDMGTELMESDPPPAELLSSVSGHEVFVAAFDELYD
jgi:hypothetical protein